MRTRSSTVRCSSVSARMADAPAGIDLRQLLLTLQQQGGSDCHLKLGRPPMLRVHGDLVPVAHPPLTVADLKGIADQVMAPRHRKEFEEVRDVDFAISLQGVGRFRVNAFQQRGSLAFAIRAVRAEVGSIAALNLPPVLNTIALRTRGLVLVTGVTGSGKSTALAAMIHQVNANRAVNIITIEDPIEYWHQDRKACVSQREIGADAVSFAQALRRVLRQDPDVIMIGEIRDLETLEVAMKAADTGHLVFSTLHTMDAAHTIERLLSFYPPDQQANVRFHLASTLQAVVSLRLVPRSDRPGRVPACEVLINSAAVADNMRDPSKALEIPRLIREGTVQYGMQSFDQSLRHWQTQGVISYETALRHATNPGEYALAAQGIAGASDTSWDQLSQDVR